MGPFLFACNAQVQSNIYVFSYDVTEWIECDTFYMTLKFYRIRVIVDSSQEKHHLDDALATIITFILIVKQQFGR